MLVTINKTILELVSLTTLVILLETLSVTLQVTMLRPGSFVMVPGFGDGAPGYLPTDQCWADGYQDEDY